MARVTVPLRRWLPLLAFAIPAAQVFALLRYAQLHDGVDALVGSFYVAVLAGDVALAGVSLLLVMTRGARPWTSHFVIGLAAIALLYDTALVSWLTDASVFGQSALPFWVTAGNAWFTASGLAVLAASTLAFTLTFPDGMETTAFARSLLVGGAPRARIRRLRVASRRLAAGLALRLRDRRAAYLAAGALSVLALPAWFDVPVVSWSIGTIVVLASTALMMLGEWAQQYRIARDPAGAVIRIYRRGWWGAVVVILAALVLAAVQVIPLVRGPVTADAFRSGDAILGGTMALTLLAPVVAILGVFADGGRERPLAGVLPFLAAGIIAAGGLFLGIGGQAFSVVGPAGTWEGPAAEAPVRVHLVVQRKPPRDLLASPDGRFSAAQPFPTGFVIWEQSTGLFLGQVDAGEEGTIRWVGAGQVAFIGRHTLRIYDPLSGRLLRMFRPAGSANRATAVAMSGDGRVTYTGHANGRVVAWGPTGREQGRHRPEQLPFPWRQTAVEEMAVDSTGVHAVALYPRRLRMLSSAGRGWSRALSSLTGSVDITVLLLGALGGLEPRRTVAISAHGDYVSLSTTTLDDSSRVELFRANAGTPVVRFQCDRAGFDGKNLLLKGCGPTGASAGRWSEGGGFVAAAAATPTPVAPHLDVGLSRGDYPALLRTSEDGRFVIARLGTSAAVAWDLVTGRQVQRIDERRSRITGVAIHDGELYAADSSGTLRAWSLSTGVARTLAALPRGPLHVIRPEAGRVQSIRSCTVAEQTFDGRERSSRRLAECGWMAISEHYDHVLVREGAGRDARYRLAEDTSSSGIALHGNVDIFDVTRDLARMAAIEQVPSTRINRTQTRIVVYDRQSGSDSRFALAASDEDPDQLRHVAFAGKDELVVGYEDGSVARWRISDERRLARWHPHASEVTAIAVSADGRLAFTGSRDGTIAVSSLARGEVLAQFVSLSDSSWAVVDAAGRFDASNGGDAAALHWVIGAEPIQLDQLKDRYYDPGLLAKHLGLSAEPLRDVAAFEKLALQPDMRIAAADGEAGRIGVELRSRGGGIGRVVLHVNGREVAADVRPGVRHGEDVLRLALQLDTMPFVLPGQENVAELRAFDADDHLSTRPLEYRWTPMAQARGIGAVRARNSGDPPRLFALVVGISDYSGTTLDLRFPAKDAVDFGHSLQLGATRLFGSERSTVTILSSAQGPRPSKGAILAAFRSVAAQARPGDVLVVYLAGHGVVHGGAEGQYYFLAADAQSGALGDPAVRSAVALGASEIGELMRAIPALKQILILDTCGSGGAVAGLIAQRATPSSQVRSIQRLKDRVGMFVLAGSAADAVSYEATRYGQGVLTYSLLLGMRGAALREDEYVDVSRLFSFAVDNVPQFAREIGGIQRPELAVPRSGASFDVGRLTPDDRRSIPLQQPVPVMVRSSFQEELGFADVLGLGRRVDESLRESATRIGAGVVFTDGQEIPDGYQLTGRYVLEGARVRARVRLFTGAREVGAFEEVGPKTGLEQLAARIAQRGEALVGPR